MSPLSFYWYLLASTRIIPEELNKEVGERSQLSFLLPKVAAAQNIVFLKDKNYYSRFFSSSFLPPTLSLLLKYLQ
jgi:hypothetical protein